MRKISNDELGRFSSEQYQSVKKTDIVVVLDNIRSLNNIGSVFRTSDAFRMGHVYLCGITATPPHREIQKTALGATESVDWSHHEDTFKLLSDLKTRGYTIAIIEQTDQAVLLHDFIPTEGGKIALVFGNEIHGVEEHLLPLADVAIEIPQYGTKHSVNISVSAGILIWHIFNLGNYQQYI